MERKTQHAVITHANTSNGIKTPGDHAALAYGGQFQNT